MVGSGSSKHELRKLGQILDLVNTELSSPVITPEHLMYCKVIFHLRAYSLFIVADTEYTPSQDFYIYWRQKAGSRLFGCGTYPFRL